jgi:epoxyqueuosine reductase
MLTAADAEAVCAVGRDAGLDRVGIAAAHPFDEARAALEERAAAGLASTMQFTYRRPDRSTDPSRTLPGVASLVVGARSYAHAVPDRPAQFPVAGRVARYAAADHYQALREGLDAIADHLIDDGWTARVVLDDNALVDRAAAHRAGLGWYGKNANVLVAGLGSWVVLGSVLTDAPLPTAAEPVEDGCGSCRRCLDGCPTGAIVAPGVVDARRCLAWLVQAEGVFPVEHRVALGDRLYGCDECQEVCPPSSRPSTGARVEPGETPAPGSQDWVDVLDLLASDDATLLTRFGRWYIPRREPRYLRRNALLVLGNRGTGDDPAVSAALRVALGDDDPIVRGHAVWAARRLGRDDLLALVAGESDPLVRAELDGPVPTLAASAPARVVISAPSGRLSHPPDRP